MGAHCKISLAERRCGLNLDELKPNLEVPPCQALPSAALKEETQKTLAGSVGHADEKDLKIR